MIGFSSLICQLIFPTGDSFQSPEGNLTLIDQHLVNQANQNTRLDSINQLKYEIMRINSVLSCSLLGDRHADKETYCLKIPAADPVRG